MATLSILIPHKHTDENDKALALAVDCIIRNTRLNYELLIDATTPADPYHVYNSLAAQANSDWLVLSNSDVFFAPYWDIALTNVAQPDTIVTGVLVECGAIPVSSRNIEADYGRTPETFKRAEFEAWVREQPLVVEGEGWYMPCLVDRQAFMDAGGFAVLQGKFPDQLDVWFWEKWKKAGGKVRRTGSYAYHLQNYSNPEIVHA